MVEFDISGAVLLGSVTRNQKREWWEDLHKASYFRLAAWLYIIYTGKS
jgi:hypothetical protein